MQGFLRQYRMAPDGPISYNRCGHWAGANSRGGSGPIPARVHSAPEFSDAHQLTWAASSTCAVGGERGSTFTICAWDARLKEAGKAVPDASASDEPGSAAPILRVRCALRCMEYHSGENGKMAESINEPPLQEFPRNARPSESTIMRREITATMARAPGTAAADRPGSAMPLTQVSSARFESGRWTAEEGAADRHAFLLIRGAAHKANRGASPERKTSRLKHDRSSPREIPTTEKIHQVESTGSPEPCKCSWQRPACACDL